MKHTEHETYIREQEALPYLEQAAMQCSHYRGDGCMTETAEIEAVTFAVVKSYSVPKKPLIAPVAAAVGAVV